MTIKYWACVNCGFCCRQDACSFGKWNYTLKQCEYLSFENKQSICKKYDEIIQYPQAEFNPAFGAGCCANLNTERHRIIEIKFLGVEQYITEN